MEECDQAVVDFLAATEVGKFRPSEWRYGAGAEADSGVGGGGNGFISFLSIYLSIFYLSFVSGDKG